MFVPSDPNLRPAPGDWSRGGAEGQVSDLTGESRFHSNTEEEEGQREAGPDHRREGCLPVPLPSAGEDPLLQE